MREGDAILAEAFDLAHLRRQTLGDDALRAEILGMLETRLSEQRVALDSPNGADRASIAHTICGSASSTGAARLAEAARRVELNPDAAAAMAELRQRLSEALDALSRARLARLTGRGE